MNPYVFCAPVIAYMLCQAYDGGTPLGNCSETDTKCELLIGSSLMCLQPMVKYWICLGCFVT